jgi:hypothetical protein
MPDYFVTVRYRTNSGCNAKSLNVTAPDIETALTIASDKVRKMRGVIRIDGGDCVAPPGPLSYV